MGWPIRPSSGGSRCPAASARWLLDWLDRFGALLGEHGRFADDGQRDEVLAVVDQARAWYRAIADDPASR